MAARNGNRLSTKKVGKQRNSRRRGLYSMTERQLDSYLWAKEAIRRIQRTTSLFVSGKT